MLAFLLAPGRFLAAVGRRGGGRHAGGDGLFLGDEARGGVKSIKSVKFCVLEKPRGLVLRSLGFDTFDNAREKRQVLKCVSEVWGPSKMQF